MTEEKSLTPLNLERFRIFAEQPSPGSTPDTLSRPLPAHSEQVHMSHPNVIYNLRKAPVIGAKMMTRHYFPYSYKTSTKVLDGQPVRLFVTLIR